MGNWKHETTDATTVTAYGAKWWMTSKKESFFYENGLVGPSEDNDIVVEFPDLMQGQGYRVIFGQVRDLSGAGVTADNKMEDNEEVPDKYDDAITISQVRNAIRSDGALSEQYPSDKRLRMWAVSLLKRWMAAKLDQDIYDAIGSSPTKVIYGGDATATTDIEAGDYMELALIDKAAAYAKKATPKIVGKAMGGARRLVCVMSIDQAADLRMFDASWAQAQREAMRPGNDNPIFTDSLGMRASVILKEHERCPLATTWGSGSNLNGATAYVLGVGAAGIAYAKKNIWNEKTFDYQNQKGFCIGKIYGVTKAVFNSLDNAVIAVRTYRNSN